MIVQIVLNGQIEQESHMRIRHSIEDLTSVFPSTDQSGESKLTQLMARGRLAGTNCLSDVADTHFATGDEGVDYPHPTGVGQKLETLREHKGRVVIEKILRSCAMTMVQISGRLAHDTRLGTTYMNINSDIHMIWRGGG